ncbi:CcoQ/FixQ family Cbb3-type cytochrome c oxidase assembly chaperone [Lewinella sp. LCG006]|uniref:CcoQ/FixQ family Cbb3-type cytochrome c oxidase assembly chaperone n=1 Tax=Lewinella sp. LCG006 TaxID=3231911 RepID=UPI003461294C
MYKYILASGEQSINWMAIFSLITFFLMFAISAIAIWGKSKAYVQHMAELPLDEENIK